MKTLMGVFSISISDKDAVLQWAVHLLLQYAEYLHHTIMRCNMKVMFVLGVFLLKSCKVVMEFLSSVKN